jgi:hypothetical protein
MTSLDKAVLLLCEPEARVLHALQELVSGFQALCQWAAARRGAEENADRFLTAAKEQAAIAIERLRATKFLAFQTAARMVGEAIALTSETSALANVVEMLSKLPVPPFLISAEKELPGIGEPEAGTPPRSIPEGPFVIRSMLTLDGRPWANPHLLRAGIIYDLRAKVTAPAWPSLADRLVLDFISTLPSEHRRASQFEISREEAEQGLEVTATGHIEFPVGQSLFAEPLLLQLRGTFLSATDAAFARSATIIGYRKLRVRVSDPATTPMLARYRILDQRLVDIVDAVRFLPGVSETHLAEFVDLLAAILNYVGICAQQAVYRAGQNIKESDFQRNLLQHLRGQLGEGVQEAPKLGGGITDIRYCSVTAELKVERSVTDREEMLKRYQNQPTQYSSATGTQLGILCVLDLTEKILPPAPPQNGVRLLTPQLHGFDGKEPPFPVRIAAVIIDGNIKNPSDYSR